MNRIISYLYDVFIRPFKKEEYVITLANGRELTVLMSSANLGCIIKETKKLEIIRTHDILKIKRLA